MQEETKTNFRFIGQGTYGCVYKPNVPCLNKSSKTSSTKFISKIQKATVDTEVEEKIGKIITKNIRYYNTRFAPILETCNVNISTIQQREIDKCDVITKARDEAKREGRPKTNEYKSYKMRNAGKRSLSDYFIMVAKRSPKTLFKTILESHIYLLNSIQKLLAIKGEPIVHYDLKENNVIYDEKQRCPILIDFGLSLVMKETTTFNAEVAKDNYYVYYDKYPPWCAEIMLLSYISQELLKQSNITDIINQENIAYLGHLISNFTERSEILKLGFSEEEKTRFKDGWRTYFKTFEDQSWETLFIELQKGYDTWDNYSISVMFYFIIYDILYNNSVNSAIIKRYETILKQCILAIPSEKRPSISKMIESIKMVAHSTKRDEYQELTQSISSISSDKLKNSLIRIIKRNIGQ